MRFVLPAILGCVAAAWAQRPAAPGFDELARRATAAQGRPDEAAGLYRQAVALRPSWAEGWFYLGASEYQLKRYAEARSALARAAELAPENGGAWAFLGLAEAELGDAAQAFPHIAKGESLGLPDNPQFISTVRIRAAHLAIRAADFTAAIEQLRPLAMAGDRSPAAVETMGAAALTVPQLPAEIPAARRPLVELVGQAMWALYAQHWSDAETLFRQLGERYPDEPGIHYLEGIYQVDRDTRAALAEFAKELTISPSHVMARVQIAILDLRTGDAAAALAPAREAVGLAPGNLLARLTLGRGLLESEKIAPAIQEFEAALKISPAYPHTHFYLSQAYRKAGREEDARREQMEFTRLKAAGSPTAGAGPPQGRPQK